MRVIDSDHSLSPYFNLASEEYLLNGHDDVFMLWRNADSVIVGKNQNTFSEVNVNYCNNESITIARRLTGGGAVFHDSGNVNFSFITDSRNEGINFEPFLEPILEILNEFCIDAKADGRNDIIASGFKISGNAQCVFDTKDGRKRLLHHGTLLFSADCSRLVNALNVNKEKLKSKGIKSVSSRVANIIDLPGYNGPTDVIEFISYLIRSAENRFSTYAEKLDLSEINIISKIAEEKYSTWEWNYGTSPEYNHNNSRRFDYGTVCVSYSATRGVIDVIDISGDFFSSESITELNKLLIGTKLDKEELRKKLVNIDKYIHLASIDDIIGLIL